VTLPNARAQRKAIPANPPAIVGKAEEEKAPFVDAVTVPTNRESKRLIQAAQDYIKKKEWGTAVECLQSLLEDKQDSFIEIDATDDKGKPTKRRISVRTDANRLIGELPAEGLQMYQLKYGPAADEHLKTALETNDPGLLAEVAQRYLHTRAGADATNLLGTYYLDHGSYLMANLSFERLLSRPDADKLPAKVLFKAALAARRAGDTAVAEKVWKKMADKAGRGELVFGGRKVTLDQVRTEFERAAAVAQLAPNDWALFRGNPARNAQGVGGTAYLEPRWEYSMVPPDDALADQPDKAAAFRTIRDLLQQAFLALEGKPILPAFFPVAAGDTLLVRTYDGVHAITVRGKETAEGVKKPGEMLWESRTDGGLFGMVSKPENSNTLKGWYEGHYKQATGGLAGVFFENSAVGTLTHDGKLVYLVDDMAVPPYPGTMQAANFGAPLPLGGFAKPVNYSILRAVDLENGKLVWSIGGPSDQSVTKEKDEPAKEAVAGLEFLNAYFLGPPLPLGGKLYALVEKNTELRLVCLDPSKPVSFQKTNDQGQPVTEQCPELVWQQSLGTANFRLPQDSLRRMQAAHLAYADGVLVCPTNAGVILGVDLLSHSLVWAHSYRDASQQPVNDEMQMMMNRRFRGGFVNPVPLTQERWRPSAPIIQNGKVVFTAFDGDGGALHCLNLRDGRLLWHLKRQEDDLYLAGVFGQRVLIVGKTHARALNLDNGQELWKLPTGMPSGQGTACEDVYYLPLRYAADDVERKPAVLAINLATGKPIGPPAKSRKKEALGNLMFVDGELVSQTALAVAAFPELKRMLAEIDRRLKENPTDPVGLTERGELYLDKGDLKRAVDDLRTALAHKPPADTRSKARTKLHEALTDQLQSDFPAAEKFLDEYHDLCKVDVPADADTGTKQRLADEQLRREANYLSLLGRGRERQGRLLDAFAAYEQFGALTGNKELVSVVDEPNTRSRPDVWSRGRIKGMLDRATPEQRAQVEAAIEKKWAGIRDGGDIDSVRRFVSVFGTHFRVGREAQIQLAERLLAAGTPDDLTEAETRLQGLCSSPEGRKQDPPTAARAIDVMIRVYLKRGLYEDAVAFYKQLGTEFATVPVRDGKTGTDLLNELFTDKRFLPYLEPLGVTWTGALRSQETKGQFPTNQFSLTVEPEGDRLLPFFERHRVVLDINQGGNQGWTMRLLDRATGEEEWRQTQLKPAPYFISPNFVNNGFAQMQVGFNSTHSNHWTPRFAYAAGHSLVLQLSDMVYAYNLAEHKLMWSTSLFGKNAAFFNNAQNQLIVDPNNNRLTIVHQDNRQEPVGGVGLVRAAYAVLVTKEGLLALDLTRAGAAPSVLWTKSDVPMRAELFGDDEHVYVVEPGTDNGPTTVRALRAQDGVSVPVPDFGRLYAQRVRIEGRRLLLHDNDPQGGKALRLYDVQTGQDVWRRRFSAGTVVIRSQDPEYTGVIEKDNTVTIVDARTGDVLFKTLVLPEHAVSLESANLLADRDRYYLALTRKADNGLHWSGAANSSIRSLSVNGPLYALNRTTGKLEWVCDFVPHQMLLLEQVEDLPVLLFASNYSKTANGFEMSKVKVTGVDKRTGKLIFDNEYNIHSQFHTLRIDPQAGLIELVRQDLKIQIRSDAAQSVRAAANPKDSAAGSPVLAPAAVASPAPVQIK
jgi:outer membrane protein assembly factor BamB/tetratricopeptide (TPR) repeat protein